MGRSIVKRSFGGIVYTLPVFDFKEVVSRLASMADSGGGVEGILLAEKGSDELRLGAVKVEVMTSM